MVGFAACNDEGKGGSSKVINRPPVYPSASEINKTITSLNASYPAITLVEPVGTSTEGRPITALVISDNPSAVEDEPSVRLTGGVHGNEFIPCEILVRLAEYLITEYNGNSSVRNLVDSRRIVIIPLLNPDGWELGTRNNSRKVNLNRNFSDHWDVDENNAGDTPFSEAESKAFRDYCEARIFHLSATFHSGAVVVNMPFDWGDNACPVEDDLVQSLALVYSTNGTFLLTPNLMSDNTSWDINQGTVWGWDWYYIHGSLQDWSYVVTGCVDLTIEVAESSPTTETGVEQYFQYNRDSMLAYIEAAGRGVSGYVKDTGGSVLSGVSISLVSPVGDIVTRTDTNGYYHRILQPGTYTLRFSRDGYIPQDVPVVLSDFLTLNLSDVTLQTDPER